MNGVMNEKVIVEKHEVDEQLIQKMDSIFDECIGDCHHDYFHTFDHMFEFDIRFTKIRKNEIFNLTISDKSMNLYELNQKSTVT